MMPDMLESWLILELGLHHWGLLRVMGGRGSHIIIVIIVIIHIFLAIEICWSFMFICAPILCESLVLDLGQGDTLSYKVIPLQNLSNITRGVFVQFLVIPENDNCDIDRAQYGKLMRLLEEAALALKERSVQAVMSARIGLESWHGDIH